MVNTVKKAFDLYFNTLKKVGNVSNKEGMTLIISNFLVKYLYSLTATFTQKDMKEINEVLDCLARQSCVIQDFPNLVLDNDTGEIVQGDVYRYSDLVC